MKRTTRQGYLVEQFYKMPKWLFAEEFDNLSNDAKIAYTLLKERYNLSLENGWVNEQGEVYFIFTRAEIGLLIGISKPTCIKIFKELKAYRLIEEERSGVNKPNKLFLLQPEVKKLNFKRLKTLTSGGKNSLPQEVKKFDPNKTDSNKTNSNKTDIDIVEQSSTDATKNVHVEIIDYLNQTCGTAYRTTSKKTQQLINARLKEGFTIENFKVVIYKMNLEWKNDKKMNAYLRPETLFGSKFESYLNRKEKEITLNDVEIEIDYDNLWG